MLRKIAENLWVVERPLRFGGVEIGTRMSVVRLQDGGLLMHSPVALSDELREALLAVGEPRYAVAPNRFHHLFIGEYRDAFPGVTLLGAPGLPKKRPDLPFDGLIPADAPTAWAGQIDVEHFHGIPFIGEVVLCHRASRTLLMCDLAFNIGPSAPWATRLGFRLLGRYGSFGPTLMEKLLLRDRAAARASLDRILAWDFDRVVVAHGEVLEQGGREALRAGYAWL